MTKVFIDSADVEECARWFATGLVVGATTNSTLVRGAGAPSLRNLAGQLLALDPNESHLQVLSEDPAEAFDQAKTLGARDDRVRVKIPLLTGSGELRTSLISRCAQNGIKVNVTACTTPGQAMAAVGLGVSHVSLLWCRMRDAGINPARALEQVTAHRDRSGLSARTVIGSIREPADVSDALAAGADVVTVPPPVLRAWLAPDPSRLLAEQFSADSAYLTL
ncbi:transaldolase family protein [Brachybacterium sp. GPGPB12]|uniref:transaldolase family protein n=1 Tax=Brachybacterium sp. GPGPB12 TaxID=3023517 RepID=UPI0031345930